MVEAELGGGGGIAGATTDRGSVRRADVPAKAGPSANGPLAVIVIAGRAEGPAPLPRNSPRPRPRPRPWPRSESAEALGVGGGSYIDEMDGHHAESCGVRPCSPAAFQN